MQEPVTLDRIVAELARLEAQIRSNPVSIQIVDADAAVDALAVAQAVLGQIGTLAQRYAALDAGSAPA